MAFDKLTALKDFQGNIVDNTYFVTDATTRYCYTCANGDAFRITPIANRVLCVRSTCGDLQVSMTTTITGDPIAVPGTLLPTAEGRLLLASGATAPINYLYIPATGVTGLFFYAKRSGTFWACWMDAPDQMEDAPA